MAPQARKIRCFESKNARYRQARKNNVFEDVCSDPLKSDFGYHLVWISGIKKGGQANIEYHWNELEEMALNRKKMYWYQEWMKDARKQIKIKVMQ